MTHRSECNTEAVYGPSIILALTHSFLNYRGVKSLVSVTLMEFWAAAIYWSVWKDLSVFISTMYLLGQACTCHLPRYKTQYFWLGRLHSYCFSVVTTPYCPSAWDWSPQMLSVQTAHKLHHPFIGLCYTIFGSCLQTLRFTNDTESLVKLLDLEHVFCSRCFKAPGEQAGLAVAAVHVPRDVFFKSSEAVKALFCLAPDQGQPVEKEMAWRKMKRCKDYLEGSKVGVLLSV